MEKRLEGKSAYFISHDADIDGMGPIVLGKNVFGKVGYSLVNYKNIDDVIRSLIEKGVFDEYDYVFITDVCPKRETLDILSELNKRDADAVIPYKITLLDHHAAALDRNGYDFCDIAVERNSVRLCATTMFYDYLTQRGLLDSENGKVLSELTRLSDTWEWHDLGAYEADDLAELFNVIKADEYISSMSEKVAGEPVSFKNFFNESEKEIIKKRRAILDDAYDRAVLSNHFEMVDGKIVVVCDIDYEFRNGLSQYLRDIGTVAHFLAIPDYARGSMSYRTLDPTADANEFAKKFGGGGNKASAGSPITSEVIEAFNLKKPEEAPEDSNDDNK